MAIIIVSQSSHEGSFSRPFSVVAQKVSFLKEMIAKHHTKFDESKLSEAFYCDQVETENNEEEDSETDFYEPFDVNQSKLHCWWEEILLETKSEIISNGDIENQFHAPKFIPCIENLMLKFPLWSNISNKFVGISHNKNISSATVENYLSFLKSDAFKSPLRLDNAIERHIQLVDGSLKLTNTAFKKKENDMKNTTSETLNQVDEWKKRPKGKQYLKPNPQILFKNLKKGSFKPIIQNGTIRKPVKIKNDLVKVINTCAIDSLINLIGYSSFYHTTIENFLQLTEGSFFSLCKSLLNRNIDAGFYVERARLLQDHFESTSLVANMKQVTCASTVQDMASKVLSKFSLAVSFHRKSHKDIHEGYVCLSSNFKEHEEVTYCSCQKPLYSVNDIFFVDILWKLKNETCLLYTSPSPRD